LPEKKNKIMICDGTKALTIDGEIDQGMWDSLAHKLKNFVEHLPGGNSELSFPFYSYHCIFDWIIKYLVLSLGGP
jgi:hypothetical protein